MLQRMIDNATAEANAEIAHLRAPGVTKFIDNDRKSVSD